jgi:hypothetical protein
MIENLMTGLVIASAVGASLMYWLTPWLAKWRGRLHSGPAEAQGGRVIPLHRLQAGSSRPGCSTGCKDCGTGCGR